MQTLSHTVAAEVLPSRRRAARGPAAATMDVVAWLGSLVTLTALLVLAAAAGGLADGVPAEDAVTVTHER